MLLAIGLVAVPLGLVMLQPDLGSAMVLGFAAFGVLVAAGVRARWTVGLLSARRRSSPSSRSRAACSPTTSCTGSASFTHPNHDVQGAAYNVTQAHIAIANGGLFGTGLFHGPQTNGGFVPEQQTDFVFSVAGEEFGLVGGAVIIALFAAAVLARAAHRPRRRPRPAGSSRSGSSAGSPSRRSRTSG